MSLFDTFPTKGIAGYVGICGKSAPNSDFDFIRRGCRILWEMSGAKDWLGAILLE